MTDSEFLHLQKETRHQAQKLDRAHSPLGRVLKGMLVEMDLIHEKLDRLLARQQGESTMWFTIRAAAEKLGTTPEEVERRIARNELSSIIIHAPNDVSWRAVFLMDGAP